MAAFSTRHNRVGSTRPFSSSTRFFQDQTPKNPPAEEQGTPIESEVNTEVEPEAEAEADSAAEEVLDTETIVRQARQTFGYTLPANYLSEEEYRLYERLYAPADELASPLRQASGPVYPRLCRLGVSQAVSNSAEKEEGEKIF